LPLYEPGRSRLGRSSRPEADACAPILLVCDAFRDGGQVSVGDAGDDLPDLAGYGLGEGVGVDRDGRRLRLSERRDVAADAGKVATDGAQRQVRWHGVGAPVEDLPDLSSGETGEPAGQVDGRGAGNSVGHGASWG